MGVFRFFQAWRLERARVRLAVSLAENWRARGCFLRLGDGVLFDLALFWVRAFEAARALDGVEAGREARARKVADLCVGAALSQGESVLNFEGLPLWAVQRVFEDGGAGCAAESVEAGREARARKVADLCVSAALSQGDSVLPLDGLQLWAVSRVFRAEGADVAVAAEGKA